MVDKANNKLSIKKQCQLLQINRSGIYYNPQPESELNLELMRKIDEHYMTHSYMGVPSMTVWLNMDQGYHVNVKRISRLYGLMGISAIIPGPHTSKRNKEHKVYPYLLRNLKITHVNQVWAIDITYIPIKKGYMYLVAIIDLCSRFVVSWSLSNTMEAQWCKETVQQAIEIYGKPEILNSDQGSQFTSEVFADYILSEGIKFSMDGKGRATDNIFIERLWRTLKYEKIYPNDYSNGLEVRKALIEFFHDYNYLRRHSSIDHKRPFDVYQAA